MGMFVFSLCKIPTHFFRRVKRVTDPRHTILGVIQEWQLFLARFLVKCPMLINLVISLAWGVSGVVHIVKKVPIDDWFNYCK